MKTFVFLFIAVVFLGSLGCNSMARTRRVKYLEQHPELSQEQKSLLLKGKLWVGMTEDDARASLGSPYIVQEDLLGEDTIWSYRYRTNFTTHHGYVFDRIERLQFREGRLVNWRED